jgi:acyl-CoA synthetase (AMP-forming)/AMP-acid ligase II
MNRPCNIAARLPELARERPDQIAIRCPGRRGAGNGMAAYDVTLDSRQLDARSDAMAAGLAGYGIGRGVRTVVMVDDIVGCPHEEGVDYPSGRACPQCPYWAKKGNGWRGR